MSRLLARAIEANILIDHLFELLEKYDLTKPCIKSFDLSMPVTSQGTAFTMASRGDLIHHVEAVNGKISKYKMIVPSTWNFGPTIENKKGVVEKALIDTKLSLDKDAQSIELGRIVRSFDPCTACSVH
jgi:Ni,Fe-hydrogenase I large subunit